MNINGLVNVSNVDCRALRYVVARLYCSELYYHSSWSSKSDAIKEAHRVGGIVVEYTKRKGDE